MKITELIKNAGVVGAGGAGFPTHVKLSAKAEAVIANGAECEPLLRVDRMLMASRAQSVISGLESAMAAVGAKTGIIATKEHYRDAVESIKAAIENKPQVRLRLIKSYYPAGDEKSLIYETTGRIVPSGKLPADVGLAVCNVGTLVNVANAVSGLPVTHKYLTVAGDVKSPVTVRPPIGTPMRKLLEIAGMKGGEADYALIVGGPLMGRLEENWDSPVTKTTGGLLLLSRNHPLILKRTLPLKRQLRLVQAVCCQCSQCTQLCPRSALGLGAAPHKAMRAAANADARLLGSPNVILACSSCGLCSAYACDMGLNPSAVMEMFKEELSKAGIRPLSEENPQADNDIRLRRIPLSRLIARMGLSEFDVPAALKSEPIDVDLVRLPLSMHIGKPAVPVVSEGDVTACGSVIAEIPGKALGARVHASISGRVSKITGQFIEITRGVE